MRNEEQLDPLEKAILQKEVVIKNDVSLVKKEKPINRIAIITSLILVSGVIIGLFRILLQFFQ